MAKSRVLRWLLLIVGLVVALVVVALVVVSTSSFQTWAALKVLRGVDPQAQLASASFGPSGGVLQGLALNLTGGPAIKVEAVKVRFSLGNILFGKIKVVDNLYVSGLVVDATAGAPTSVAPPVAVKAGPGNGAASFGFLIKEADVALAMQLPEGRNFAGNLTARDFGAGGAGAIQGQFLFQDLSANATVREMRANAQGEMVCDAAGQPLSITLGANLSATLPGQPQPAQLQARLESKSGQNGDGTFTLALAQPGASAALLQMSGNYNINGSVRGDFTAAVGRAQIEPFALGRKLPDFDLQGSGQFASDATQKGSLKAELQARAGGLGVLSPALSAMGNLQGQASLDLAWSASGAQAQRLSITLAPAGGGTVATLELLKPVAVEFKDGVAKLTQGSGADLAKLTLAAMPAAWAGAALPENLAIRGGALSGQLTFSARDDGTMVAQITQNLTLAGLTLTDGGQPFVAATDIELAAGVEYHDGRAKAEISRFLVTSQRAPMAQYAGQLNLAPASPAAGLVRVTAEGHLAMALDRLGQQPFARAWAANLPPGATVLDSTFNLGWTPAALEVNTLQASLTQGQTALVTVVARQKFSMPMGKEFTMPALSGDVATLTAQGLPVSLLQPFLPKETIITGDPITGNLTLSGIAGGTPGLALRTEQPLTMTNFRYVQAGEPKLSGVTLTLTPQGQWRSGEWQGSLRALAASPAGNLLDGAVEASSAAGKLSAVVVAKGNLGAVAAQPVGAGWRSALPGVKPEYSLNSRITQDETTTTIQSADIKIASPGATGPALADVKLLQAFSLPRAPAPAAGSTAAVETAPFKLPALSGEVLSASFADLPPGVFEFALPGYTIKGDVISGNFTVRGEGGGAYILTTSTPWQGQKLSIQKGDQEWVANLDFRGTPTVKFGAGGLTYYAVKDLNLSSGGVALALGSFEVTPAPGQSFPAQASLQLQGDVAQLFNQPVLRPYNNLAAGQLTLSGNLGPGGVLNLSAEANGWKVRSPAREFTQMAFLGVTGRVNSTQIQLVVPVMGKGVDGNTECRLTFAQATQGSAMAFDLSVEGSSLAADDVMAIVNAFHGSGAVEAERPPGAPAAPGAVSLSPPAAIPGAAAAKPDGEPFWGLATGQVRVNLQRLVFHDQSFEDLRGQMKIAPSQISLDSLTTRFSRAPLSLGAVLTFDKTQARSPYGLKAQLGVKDFDTAIYFAQRNPGARPPVAGKFSIDGAATGQGANLDDLLQRVQFDFKLGSNGGTFYVLDMAGKNTATALGIGTGIAGIALSLLGKKPAPALQQLNDVISLLQEVKYDQLAFAAKRGPDLNINLAQFYVQSPEIYFSGSGKITFQPGVPIPAQPLSVSMQLNARGRTANLLASLSLMQAPPANSTTYANGPQFDVSGTLQQPNYDGLYNLLVKAASGGLARILGGN